VGTKEYRCNEHGITHKAVLSLTSQRTLK
jgi:hypothetical protein